MVVTPEDIARITQHSSLTDAVIANIGETLALQQALLNVPPFDGRNLDLKSFLQDVEAGESQCPEGIKHRYYSAVVGRLRDTARDAVTNKNITDLKSLKDALKEYFAPRKTYTHYTAEIQGVRLRQNETIMEYYNRLKRLMDSATASLKEKYTNEQVTSMNVMLEGIALESFKRGLSDEMLYALSVQEPTTLEQAVTIAKRIERDMLGVQNRKGHVSIIERPLEQDTNNPKRVHFDLPKLATPPWKTQHNDEERNQLEYPHRGSNEYAQKNFRNRDHSPYRNQTSRNSSPYRNNNETRNRDSSPYRNQENRGSSPYRGYNDTQLEQNREYNRNEVTYHGQSPVAYRYPQQEPYPMVPQVPPLPYQYLPPYPFVPPFLYPYPHYNYPSNTRVNEQNRIESNSLNSKPAHPKDAVVSDPHSQRPVNIKFITAEDLTQAQPKNQHP